MCLECFFPPKDPVSFGQKEVVLWVSKNADLLSTQTFPLFAPDVAASPGTGCTKGTFARRRAASVAFDSEQRMTRRPVGADHRIMAWANVKRHVSSGAEAFFHVMYKPIYAKYKLICICSVLDNVETRRIA